MAEEVGLYNLKKVSFKGKELPIIMQNENGPCPLIAICNILLLQGKIFIHSDYSMVTFDQLIGLIGDHLMAKNPQMDDAVRANYEHNVADALATMPKMAVGLDVNVKFSGIDKFEFTCECLVFDVFNIRLVHGWVVDPQEDVAAAILPQNLSYNQLVDKVVDYQTVLLTGGAEKNPQIIKEGEMIEKFLRESASQLTFFGLYKLHDDIDDEEFCVFFRNNHFSTLYKTKDKLYLLATDCGYLREKDLVWEALSEIDGDSNFVDSDFKEYVPHQPSPKKEEGEEAKTDVVMTDAERQEQLEADYLLAMQLSQEDAPSPVAGENPERQLVPVQDSQEARSGALHRVDTSFSEAPAANASSPASDRTAAGEAGIDAGPTAGGVNPYLQAPSEATRRQGTQQPPTAVQIPQVNEEECKLS